MGIASSRLAGLFCLERRAFAPPVYSSADMTTSDSSRLVVRSTGVVILATVLGRITGFGREWLVAHILGTNSVTDAYYAAFTLPTFVSYLVAGGFLGIVLI